MSGSLRLAPRTFPARLASLGFTAQLPADWISHELPGEDVDFSVATAFAPLAVVTAPHAALIFAIAARPAYENGTLSDWSLYLLSHHGLRPRTLGVRTVAGVPTVAGDALQDSEVGPLVVRFAFLEDGGRLLNLTLTAPELLADSVAAAWPAFLDSFTLSEPRGATAAPPENLPLLPDAASEDPADGAAETAPEGGETPPAALAEAPSPTSGEAPTTDAAGTEANDAGGTTSPGPATFAQFALGADAATLDPDHPVNARLRDNGVGLVPNVAATFDDARRATVAAGAIVARFDVPYGWHVIDDGRRTLVFEPTGAVQISLNLVPRQGRGTAAVLDEIEAAARSEYPAPEFTRLENGDCHALGVRNIQDGAQPLEQYHLLIPGRDSETLLRARITTTPERSSDAVNLGELLVDSVSFDGV